MIRSSKQYSLAISKSKRQSEPIEILEKLLIKIDLLSVEALDKVHTCLDLLADQGYIIPEATLRETYEKYLNVYEIERNDPKMWKMVHKHEIQSLFQMEKQSGIQGIALTKPQNVDDLAVLNSVIRLMAQDKDAEQPLNKYARFKSDIRQWYKEMDTYHLTAEEKQFLHGIVGQSYGIAESQEKIMTMVQRPELGGFSLSWADSLRKAVAKKQPEAYIKLEKEFFENAKTNNLSMNLCKYAWNVLIAMSRGYSFNASHTLAYSLVALQEMNLAFKYPIIFWNCACLITDSGGNNSEEEIVDIYAPEYDDLTQGVTYEDLPDKSGKIRKTASTDYTKIATAMGKMLHSGIAIEPPNINHSAYTFYPDADNNKILFGLSGILSVGEELINTIIQNRPYASPKDFLQKVNPKKPAMISLIKGGAFDDMLDRKLCMGWYIWETCDKKKNITLQNMASLIKYNLLPEDTEERILARRVYEFNRYLKAKCKYDAINYKLDERAINFLIEINAETLIKIDNLMDMKLWDKRIYQNHMNVFRTWIAENKAQILDNLNTVIFKEDWDKYALGSISAWEMEALCFYYHEHELTNVNTGKYGISDFFKLPEEPEVEKVFYKSGKEIPIYKLTKICGTCIAKNKAKATATLLTTTGVVEVKFNKEYFAMFDKRISERGSDGVKHIKEQSWYNRGNMLFIQGMRRGDQFVSKKYASSSTLHQLYKIESVDEDGDLILRHTRAQGEEEEDA